MAEIPNKARVEERADRHEAGPSTQHRGLESERHPTMETKWAGKNRFSMVGSNGATEFGELYHRYWRLDTYRRGNDRHLTSCLFLDDLTSRSLIGAV